MHDREATEDSLVEADGLADFAAARQAGSSQASGSFRSRDTIGVTRESVRPAVYQSDGRDTDWRVASQPLNFLPQRSFDPSSSRHNDNLQSPSLHHAYTYDIYSPPALPSPAPTYSNDTPHFPLSFPSFPPSPHHPSPFARPTSSYGTPSHDAFYTAPVFLYDDPSDLPSSPPAHSSSYRDPFSHDDVVFDNDETRGDLAYALSDEREKGEWFEAAGSYQQGVGFEGVSGSRRSRQEEQTAARMEKLERKFGEQSAAHPANLSAKQRMKEARDAKRAERLEVQGATGVDDKGRLIVMGRRKRLALKWFQTGGAAVVGIGSIGASVLTHPKEEPPPSGSAPLLVLYLLPFLSLFLTTYLFLIRPLLYKRRSQQPPQPQNNLITPLLQQPQPQTSGGWCDCFGSSRRRVPRGQYHPPQINLIVDPRLMAAMQRETMDEGGRARQDGREKRRRRRRRPRSPSHERDASESSSSLGSEDDKSDSDEDDPWTAHPSSSRTNPRKSLLSHVLLDTTWRAARSWAKKVAVADAVCAVVWGGVAGWAVFGGRKCPVGGFEGYWYALLCLILLST
ncbi:hypothetical protein NBRC10513_002154 [Rhodotorula toruloides]